jgi:hypothetical protein
VVTGRLENRADADYGFVFDASLVIHFTGAPSGHDRHGGARGGREARGRDGKSQQTIQPQGGFIRRVSGSPLAWWSSPAHGPCRRPFRYLLLDRADDLAGFVRAQQTVDRRCRHQGGSVPIKLVPFAELPTAVDALQPRTDAGLDDVLGIHDRYAEEAAGGVVIGEPETRHGPKSIRAAGCRKPLQGGGGRSVPFERVSVRAN